ncbi:hypothetical protein N9P29_01365 [bacterium]|nr:hypothetical protein [bacterium]
MKWVLLPQNLTAQFLALSTSNHPTSFSAPYNKGLALMNYKKEMRHLIDIVKQQSFDAPLEQTLDDMKTLTTAVKDLSDRIEMRVRKNINPKDKATKAKSKSKKPSAMPKATIPKTKPTTSTNNSLPTGNSVSSSSVSAKDFDNIKTDFMTRQKSVQPVTPQPPV